jgi:hypothetical protein
MGKRLFSMRSVLRSYPGNHRPTPPFYQSRNNERRKKKTKVLTQNKYMAMGPSRARCQEWPCWLVAGSKLLLCSALLTVQFYEVSKWMPRHAVAVRFRSVCEDIKNEILACKIVSCINVTQHNKWLCEIVIKPMNNLNGVSQVPLNTVQLVVRSDQVPLNIVQNFVRTAGSGPPQPSGTPWSVYMNFMTFSGVCLQKLKELTHYSLTIFFTLCSYFLHIDMTNKAAVTRLVSWYAVWMILGWNLCWNIRYLDWSFSFIMVLAG